MDMFLVLSISYFCGMISVENIAISFNGHFLFKNFSFQLKDGATVGLAGKNGAGKSTLLKLLTGELDYDEGNLVIPKGYKIGYLKQDLVQQGNNSVRDEAMKAFSDQAEMDIEYERISKELETKFRKEFNLEAEVIKDYLYKKPNPNTYLAKFAKFLVQNKDLKYSKKLIKKGFNLFISNQIRQFDNCKDVDLHFVGSIGFYLKDELEKRINKKNLKLGKVLRRPIEGLVAYHQGL